MEDKNHRIYERFDSLTARHAVFVKRLCMRHAEGNRNRCAELIQECYITIWRYLPNLREGASMFHERAWVAWQCRSTFSHLRYRRQALSFLPINENIADTVANFADDGLRDYIDSLAVGLTPYEQRAFAMMADGWSVDEMARELGLKHQSATVLRHRIIKKLKKQHNIE